MNYLYFLSGKTEKPRNYSDLEREFPTLISSYIKDNQPKKGHPLTSQFGYTDICYNHGRPLPLTPKGRYVRKYEDKTNKRLHAKNGGINFIEGTKFTRNGSIGQWQEYLSDKDIKIIEENLMERDISLDEFRLYSKTT